MNESDFLQKLQKRAHEQEQLMQRVPFPDFFSWIASALGESPYRILIPLAFLLSLILQFVFGKSYDDSILKIFGGLGLMHFY